ncbi:LacI family DNA-binding transcriptional regulator [Effusibacillus pohliae]|uniref:LacI family DNA-binding transcriptional regulator n=1 Tax=Effusibacillus pohliae TaxID=232270 RepID=UPI00036DB427|nr:LacI family DNA-binding transcriptional regulator [Effusibacillus pohliae]
MGPTIRDVAKAAGVSITTVSRVLNQYADVNPKTRQKVLKVVEKMGYQPNAVARGLVMNRTRTVGLVVSDLTKSRTGHHFMFDVLCGINDRAQELGYDVVLFSTSPTAQRKTTYLEFVRQRRVDGVIMMGIRLDDPYTHEVVEAPIPSVLVDVPLTSSTCSYVTTDNVAGARMATEYLLRLGHRHIGFVNGHQQAAVSQQRLAGYTQALAAAGVPFREEYVYYGNFELVDGANGVQHLKQQHPHISAVFFASDLMALGGMKYIQANGGCVPGDLSIVGFDDIDLASLMQPALTTVRQMRYEMGKSAVDTLLRMLEDGETGKGIVLPPELIVRETAQPFAQ